MKFTTQVIAAFAAFASSTKAHMIMHTPQPFNNPDSSPINADGSNFPCKIAGGSGDVSSGPANAMTVGQMNTLSFTGGATHGGGSCQVSMAKGTTVNAQTKWMVIYSIEGNCPIEGTSNLSGNPDDTGSNKFQFAVPDHPDLPAGDYTLAWTWNNKIGNREFYMNCAYVQLSGASKKRYEPSQPVKKDQTPLPDMLVANIPQGNGCNIPETFDLLYPNPGDPSRVLKASTGGPYNFALPSGNCGAVNNAAATGSASFAASGAATGAATGAASATAATGAAQSTMTNTVVPIQSASAAAGTRSASAGVFATVGGSSGGASQATSMATVAASSAAAATPTTFATSAAAGTASVASSAVAPAGTGTSGGGSTTTVGAQSGPCTDEGAWACSADGTSFQRCASGQWSAAMQMAAGMTCVPGISDNLSYNTSGGSAHKRHRRHEHNLHAVVHS